MTCLPRCGNIWISVKDTNSHSLTSAALGLWLSLQASQLAARMPKEDAGETHTYLWWNSFFPLQEGAELHGEGSLIYLESKDEHSQIQEVQATVGCLFASGPGQCSHSFGYYTNQTVTSFKGMDIRNTGEKTCKLWAGDFERKVWNKSKYLNLAFLLQQAVSGTLPSLSHLMLDSKTQRQALKQPSSANSCPWGILGYKSEESQWVVPCPTPTLVYRPYHPHHIKVPFVF